MPVRSCRQPWGMKSPKRMDRTVPASPDDDHAGAGPRTRGPHGVAGVRAVRQDGSVLQSWTSAQVRAAEEHLLAAGVPLMERAAFALHVRVCAVLATLRGRVAGSRVLVLVGPGNNGGDALYAGALLARRGVEVRAV